MARVPVRGKFLNNSNYITTDSRIPVCTVDIKTTDARCHV